MPAESGDQNRAAAVKAGAGAPPLPPPEKQEHLPCPRCDSTNTKFCYYNNYNLSQPRHFCKSCRRYWTQGGTLRDIPVGGATRKSAKRSRTLPPPPSLPQTSSASPAAHFSVPVPSVGSFTSLLTASASSGSGGFLALGGLGLGIGPRFDDGAFGPLGRALWAFPEVGYFGSNGGSAGGIGNGTVTCTGGDGGTSGGMSAWQLESGGDQAGGGGFVGGDCFPSWPELAISTPGNGLK